MPKNNIIDVQRSESSPTEPVTLAEAKAQIIVTSSDDDTYISSLITQSRRAIENFCSVSMVEKVVTLYADIWEPMELPYGPCVTPSLVKRRSTPTGSGPVSYDDDPGQWTVDGSEFLTFAPPFFGYWDWGLPVPRRYSLLNCYEQPVQRFKIVYTAGPYTPDDLRLAVLNELAYRYENRGDDIEIRPTVSAEQGLSSSAIRLAEPYKRLSWL